MTQLGDYQLSGDPTSGGNMSTCAAVRDGQELRLRFADDALSPTDAIASAFTDDLARAARCAHIAVVSPAGGAIAPRLHVATEVRAGETLGELLADEDGGRLPVEECLGLALDLAAGLAAAHAEGLVHGGLGLDAVWVDAEGYSALTDYAIGRALAAMAPSQPALMNVSIDSLAPEQVSGGAVTEATDLFGLGNVLYRCLTGKPPFAAPSALGVSMRLKMGALDPLERHEASLPPALRSLVHRLLGASPGTRPNAEETRTLLEPLMDMTGAWRGALKARVSTAEAPRDRAMTVAHDGPLVSPDEIPDFLRPSAPPGLPRDPDTSQVELPPAFEAPAAQPVAPPAPYRPAPVAPAAAQPAPYRPPPAAVAAPSPPAMAHAAPPRVGPASVPPPAAYAAPAAVPEPQSAVVRDYAPTMKHGMPAASPELLAAAFGDELDADELSAPITELAPSDAWDEWEGEPTRMEQGLAGDPAPLSVPKTVVMSDPRAAQPLTAPPNRSAAQAPMRPPPNLPMVSAEMDAIAAPPGRATKSGGNGLTVLIWVGVGLGAFLLLGATVALAIILVG